VLKSWAGRFRDFVVTPILREFENLPQGPDTASQIELMLAFRRLVEEGRVLPAFNEVGFKCYSQSDEDGILWFIFSVLGVTNKRCVEICAGDGRECNAANLILNHGWHGLLIDGNADNVRQGNRFFAASRQTYVYPPQFVCSWITRTTANDTLATQGFTGPIDLLSLDLDGVDYWIRDSIDVITPRVVVLEYQDILGPERSCTVPYADDFSARNYPMTNGIPNFAGASLSAFVKLGRRKGYRLVGVNRYGYNAFFVNTGLGENVLPEIDVKTCFDHPKVVWGMRERFQTVKDLPWVTV
jgi:hypothetical protein